MGKKIEGELVERKQLSCRQNVEEFWRRTRHVAKKCVQSYFGGKLPHARQNSAGLDFVERKRHGAGKKPPWLIGCKPPWSFKMEGVLVGKKRHWGTENVGEFLRRKRHVAENCSQTCLGEGAQGRTKFSWCGFWGRETARWRKEASKVVEVKAAPWSFAGENGTWLKNGCKVVWGKAAPGRTKFGGVDFVERKRHGAVKNPLKFVR
ncbi:hypothetical protein T10_11049 [Trichinella papuae]|uniref:Uncharacterized protein n=1 Tax=Trichinella papuae TaxID=268474 RepID=A0A0V1LZN8_9BILA|nr:hypothetical protein T10_11049 [Trichinella papuae]